jgi:hypothetical protein
MRVAVVLGIALAMAAPLAGQKSGPPKQSARVDTVHLRFGWPVGLNARVSAHKFKARSSNGKADTTNVRMSYELSVEPHASGRLVRFHHFAVPGVPVMDLEDEELQERVAAVMPSLIVDTTGEFVSVLNVSAMQRELDAMLGPASKNPLVERFRSPEVLTAIAANEWNALVGTWVGGDLDLGITYSAEFEQPFPLFPDATIQMVQEFTVVDRVPCRSNESERRCVELESIVRPDPAAFSALIARMMGEVLPDSISLSGSEMQLETVIRLVAEPGTLVPYVLEVSKVITMSMPGEGAMHQEEIKTTRYEYPRRR